MISGIRRAGPGLRGYYAWAQHLPAGACGEGATADELYSVVCHETLPSLLIESVSKPDISHCEKRDRQTIAPGSEGWQKEYGQKDADLGHWLCRRFKTCLRTVFRFSLISVVLMGWLALLPRRWQDAIFTGGVRAYRRL